MATRYWVGGGTASWDAPPGTSTNWSTSSGGAGGASRPTSADAVVFDSNSGTGTAYINTGAVCASLTTTGSTKELTGGVVAVHGNVTLSSGITCSGLRLSFEASGTMASNSRTIYDVVVKNGATLTCSDSANCSQSIDLNDGSAIVFPAGATSYCGSLLTPASGGATVSSSSAGVQATLSDSSGENTLTYVTITDMVLTGGATWTTSTGFTDGGNNSIDGGTAAFSFPLFAQSHL